MAIDPPHVPKSLDPFTKGHEVSLVHHHIWQETRISGALRKLDSFGQNWWYRLQLADKDLAAETFEQFEIFGRPLADYAQAWYDLPDGGYHVVWKPQWVPAGSVNWKLRESFWERVPSRFWSLSRPLGEDMIWREEVGKFVNLSRDESEHLCACENCQACWGGDKLLL